ncbi:hypothetical protein IU487_32295 [Nocardia puris]|uniref:hypothetical protein n=1 Tax=Nocardia puris TaxID=208602 RepID=UPI0018954D66|nr:hypothetical protein [Nocardia puris]MBF6215680.1 hypothetical protein [Nocardia puris]
MTEVTAIGFRPDLKPDDLQVFVDEIRPAMPPDLWSVVEPYTLVPRAWDSQKYGVDVPMEAAGGQWVCELNAPERWHELVERLDSVELAVDGPTAQELAAAWGMLKAAGLSPSVAVNLGPAQVPGKWLVAPVAVVVGAKVDLELGQRVADVLGGHLGGIATFPEAAWWQIGPSTATAPEQSPRA